MSNEKGGLIKKKKKPIVQNPVTKQPVQKQTEQKKSQTIGKQYSKKSLKVPSKIHTQINLLGSFMDENKSYMILQQLIDSYLANELTNHQRCQFEFMLEASLEEK